MAEFADEEMFACDPPLADMLRNLTPAVPIDYIELRTQKLDSSKSPVALTTPTKVASAGTPCKTATDPTQCATALANAVLPEDPDSVDAGWISGGNPSYQKPPNNPFHLLHRRSRVLRRDGWRHRDDSSLDGGRRTGVRADRYARGGAPHGVDEDDAPRLRPGHLSAPVGRKTRTAPGSCSSPSKLAPLTIVDASTLRSTEPSASSRRNISPTPPAVGVRPV